MTLCGNNLCTYDSVSLLLFIGALGLRKILSLQQHPQTMRRAAVLQSHTVPSLSKMPGWAMHRVERIDKNLLLENRSLKGKTLFITGASRGIGLAIALRAAKDGANIVVAAKTDVENPKLPGTIYSAAKEIEAAGGKALAVKVDVRDEKSVEEAVAKAVATFGGIDILINNASAINLTGTEKTDMKRYDLMHSINTRGTFLCTKLCIPHLRKAENPHVINLSPPLNMDPKWFAPHVAYTMAKFGMSMCVLGHAEELKGDGIAVNALWPRTTIATAAVNNLLGGDALMQVSRTPELMGEAAHCILTRKSKLSTGNFFIDDEVMASEGLANDGLKRFNANPNAKYLAPDFFV
jgi:citronellol/citronellal dehydrogenase